MAKLTAWLMTLIGVLFTLPLLGVILPSGIGDWLIAASFLVIGVSKLLRNYKK